ncbi:MAG TPA: hypothetical protein VLG11_06175 [Candidatus Saccharimonadales bacterium]|nr:hypothetical protein [Candidatus Saccharimonadales bacterium]
MLGLKQKFYRYNDASPEEVELRRTLMGAILEFGEPHAFETGVMTRPLETATALAPAQPQSAADTTLAYYMLQEDGAGYAVFGALRTIYDVKTAVEPVRLAVQFVTVRGTAVIDVAIPSRYAIDEKGRDRSYEEKLGPHIRVAVLTKVKGAKLEDILIAFAGSKSAPTADFKPLLTVMREQGETKKREPLKPAHLKLLTEFIKLHFGDFSAKVPTTQLTPEPEEIIPETPEEVAQSDGWLPGLANAIEQTKHGGAQSAQEAPRKK